MKFEGTIFKEKMTERERGSALLSFKNFNLLKYSYLAIKKGNVKKGC